MTPRPSVPRTGGSQEAGFGAGKLRGVDRRGFGAGTPFVQVPETSEGRQGEAASASGQLPGASQGKDAPHPPTPTPAAECRSFAQDGDWERANTLTGD